MDLNFYFKDTRILKYIRLDSLWINKIKEIRQIFNFYEKINIILFDSVKEIEEFLGFEVPIWVIGTNRNNTIIILDFEQWKDRNLGDFTQIVIHEFLHIIVSKISKGTCPLWLSEGIAMYFADQRVNQGNYLLKNYSCGNIYDLSYDDLKFYDICSMVVEHLINTYGIETIINNIKITTNYRMDGIFGIENINLIISNH